MVKKHWSINNGKTWQRSGAKIFLQPKEYTVKFSDVYGLETPNDIETTIVANQHIVINVNYYSYDSAMFINVNGLDDTVSLNLDMIIKGINDDEIVIQSPEGGSQDYDTLIAIGFSGGDLSNPVNGNYDCSILNGTWNRITTTDDATLQTNGFKTQQWQHADHGFILKYVSNQNRWEIHSNDIYIAFEACAGNQQLIPWDEVVINGNVATFWAGMIALPINGKFYLKSTTQQEGFGAKYQIVGCPNDDYNGYYKLSDEKSFNNNPVYVNTKESNNPTKMIIMDEALAPRIQLGTGSYFSGVWIGQYQYGEYGGFDTIQSNAEMWQLLTGTAVPGMKCIIL